MLRRGKKRIAKEEFYGVEKQIKIWQVYDWIFR